MIPGMTTVKPSPQPIMHRREFSKDELAVAMREYLEKRGVVTPQGEIRVSVIERYGDQQSCVTLIILEQP